MFVIKDGILSFEDGYINPKSMSEIVLKCQSDVSIHVLNISECEFNILVTTLEFENWLDQLETIDTFIFEDDRITFVFARAFKRYLQWYPYRVRTIRIIPAVMDTREDNAPYSDLFWEGVMNTSIQEISVPGGYYHDRDLMVQSLCGLQHLIKLQVNLDTYYNGRDGMFDFVCEFLKARPNQLQCLNLIGNVDSRRIDELWSLLYGSTSLKYLGIPLFPGDVEMIKRTFKSLVNLEYLGFTDYDHDGEYEMIGCIPLLPRLRGIDMKYNHITRDITQQIKRVLFNHSTIEQIRHHPGVNAYSLVNHVEFLRSNKVLVLCALTPVYVLPRFNGSTMKMLPKHLLRNLSEFL